MQNTSAELSLAVTNKIWINKWLNLEFPYFSILHVHFGQIQYFFKVLKTDFKIQYFQYRVGTLCFIEAPQYFQCLTEKWKGKVFLRWSKQSEKIKFRDFCEEQYNCVWTKRLTRDLYKCDSFSR